MPNVHGGLLPRSRQFERPASKRSGFRCCQMIFHCRRSGLIRASQAARAAHRAARSRRMHDADRREACGQSHLRTPYRHVARAWRFGSDRPNSMRKACGQTCGRLHAPASRASRPRCTRSSGSVFRWVRTAVRLDRAGRSSCRLRRAWAFRHRHWTYRDLVLHDFRQRAPAPYANESVRLKLVLHQQGHSESLKLARMSSSFSAQ